MENCFKIKKVSELEDYLIKYDLRDPNDFDYQLQTNRGLVYELKNGEFIFIPGDFTSEGLLLKNKECFKEIVENDAFPFENPDKDLFQTEIERIKSINKNIEFYKDHLNKTLKFNFQELTREAAQAYMKKIIGRSIKKLTTNTDLVALIAIIGEIFKREIEGMWVLEKWYGLYNPYYIPCILTKRNKLIFIGDTILTQLKWKVSSIDLIFNKKEGSIDLKERGKHRACFILED
jgi:hypothetical protein